MVDAASGVMVILATKPIQYVNSGNNSE